MSPCSGRGRIQADLRSDDRYVDQLRARWDGRLSPPASHQHESQANHDGQPALAEKPKTTHPWALVRPASLARGFSMQVRTKIDAIEAIAVTAGRDGIVVK